MTYQWPLAVPSSGTFRSSEREASLIGPEALESILAAADVGVWQMLADGQTVIVTPSLYGLLDVPDEERPETGEQWLTRVHPADRDRVAREIDRLRSHRGSFALEAQVLAGAESHWVEVRGRVSRDEAGTFAGACGTLQDVTHRKEPEAFRDLLLATLSHDLRDPLAAIRIGASLLVRGEHLDPRGALTAGRIVSSAKRVSAMVDHILDFTRLRARGSLPCMRGPANLGQIAAAVVDEMDLVHPGRPIELEREGNLDGEWDASRLTRMISNLVSNGLLHGDPRSPVTLRVLDRGSEAFVAVHNRGATIPAAELATLFDPLGRLPRPRTNPGLGLGLFIAHEIAKAHGGTMRATSSPEEGTQFLAVLPRR